ncbi:MAG: hypothetical protein WCS70_06270 [Verrucomicrobiota bacterium]
MHTRVDNLIPHRAPMRWVDALTECTDTTATATVCFEANHFAVTDGVVLEPALVECIAQTCAAALGYRARGQAGEARLGMLTIVSDFQIHSRPLAGQQLTITVRELRRLGPMLMVTGSVAYDGQVIATGNLTLYA